MVSWFFRVVRFLGTDNPQQHANWYTRTEVAMSNARIVLTTTGSQEEARRIARALVERRLAACVNIVPQIESIYRWEDTVETSTEWLLLIKTQADSFERLRDAVKELHSYDLPECVMLELASGSKEYLDWIIENTT
jgi:periplasmic divalent cation tolerance protein